MAADAVPPLDEPRRIHIVAVGGAGMSAIARVLVEAGHDVSGSDAVAGPRLAPLAELGVHISVGHEAANVAGVDAVVVSTAVSEDNVEVIAARKAGTGVFTP
ncbi:MAG: Mur ligase domain-containing protein [Microthrixaceae bacterium]